MDSAKASLALGLAILCSGCGLPQSSVSLGAVRPDFGWGPPASSERDWLAYPGEDRGYRHGPALVCDRFGRCWRPDHDHDFERARPARPPDWAEDLPDDERKRGRFVRPDDNRVCDQATRVCYKHGNVDKTDTKQFFGERAARRADQLRDQRGTARIFVPEQGVACDRERRRCFDDGEPDRRLTRRHFGRRAAREID